MQTKTNHELRIQFRPGPIARELRARAEEQQQASLVARRDLERYYAVLRDELARCTLGPAEVQLLVAVCATRSFAPHTYLLLWAQVDHALRHGPLAQQAVDGAALVEKLRQLTPGQTMALVDAIERLRTSVDNGRPLAEAMRQVGLAEIVPAPPA